MKRLHVAPEIAGALRMGGAVVALESSVLAQGLPIPENRQAAERMTEAVRRRGAIPAITAVVRGVPTVGLGGDDLERFLAREGVRKVSARDLPMAIAQGADGATTVAAALVLARAAGVTVFATGGIGGVHRAPPGGVDVSADLYELARTPMVVVCAGAKAILDLEMTMERLETLGVPVVGFRTAELPAFYSAESGIALPARAESAGEVAALHDAQRSLGREQALVVMQPPPADAALPRALVEGAVRSALERAAALGVRGAAVTPFLLSAVERETGGRSLGANLALLEANAALAAEVAKALARRESEGGRGAHRPGGNADSRGARTGCQPG